MKRPCGPLRIARTRVLAGGDVLVADLSGKSRASVAAVRKGDRFFFVAPGGLAGAGKKVWATEACSLTDCVNLSVADLGRKAGRKARRKA
jgi:hypothetical protein